ncbi:nuclear receptor coactivator 7 isoform X1, partial [Tachysurus ichikawai]
MDSNGVSSLDSSAVGVSQLSSLLLRLKSMHGRLKKRRQLKQGQSERAMAKESQSDTDLKVSVICEPSLTTQIDERNRESEKPSKAERTLRGES